MPKPTSELCHFCGVEIRFRNIRGRPTPLHPTGSRCVGKQLYREEDNARSATIPCARCSKPVFFIRHNGGCAWFEDLGCPWDEHPCFAEDSVLPSPWQAGGQGEWRLVYIYALGLLKLEPGCVCVLSASRLQGCWSETYVEQFAIRHANFDEEMLHQLGKMVLLKSDHSSIITLSGQQWPIQTHVPSYRKPTHSIRRLL